MYIESVGILCIFCSLQQIEFILCEISLNWEHVNEVEKRNAICEMFFSSSSSTLFKLGMSEWERERLVTCVVVIEWMMQKIYIYIVIKMAKWKRRKNEIKDESYFRKSLNQDQPSSSLLSSLHISIKYPHDH
jgi:hypothetical protein